MTTSESPRATPNGTKTLRGVSLPKPPTAVVGRIEDLDSDVDETQMTHSEAMLPLSEVMALIDARVTEALAKATPVDEAPAPQVPSLYEGQYLEHFRCDPKNMLEIQERRMVQDEKTGEWEPGAGITGHKMIFIRGHFFATTENQVRQLEWMMKTPRYRRGVVGTNTVSGGRPSLWKEDGMDVVRLSGDRWVTKGSEAHKAHLRTLGQF